MPAGRVPAALGKGTSGVTSTAGSVGPVPKPHLKVAGPQLTPGPLGTNNDAADLATAKPAEFTADEKRELEILQSVYGVVRDNTNPYRTFVKKPKGHWVYDYTTYYQDRAAFFGGPIDFADFKAAALAELDADKAKLRDLIEPPKKVRNQNPDWKDAQTIFYCWVRKAYQKTLGPDVDVPKLIRANKSEALKAAMERVVMDYGQKVNPQGFNPRPKKTAGGGYRLGTISEHALGNAVDIDPAHNPQISPTIWNHILNFTGKKLSTIDRVAKWKAEPAALHKAIKEVNDEWVSRLATALKPPANADPAAKPKDPVEAAIAANADLKEIGKGFINRWKSGFYTLPENLVKAFGKEGFIWGATFPNVDLMHFELPAKPDPKPIRTQSVESVGGGGIGPSTGAGSTLRPKGGAPTTPPTSKTPSPPKGTTGPFATQDDAARAALKNANPKSIKDNLEYGGLICRGQDGKYYYTGPIKGSDQGVNPHNAPVPSRTQLVGDYHTHADYSLQDKKTKAAIRTSDPKKDDFNSDNFSKDDKTGIASDGQGIPGYAGYLGTPSGTFRKYDAATGKESVL